MVRVASVVLCIFIAQVSFAQEEVLARLPKAGKNITAFVPNGWIVIREAFGDYNKDGIKDAAVVINDSIAENESDSSRSVVILEGTKNGFQQSTYSANAVLCKTCGGVFGDPLEGLEFKDDN